MAEQKKVYPSKMRIITAVNKNGQQYKHVSVRGFACRLEQKTIAPSEQHPNGSTVVKAAMAVNKRGATINAVFGTKFPADTREHPMDETLWLNISAFDLAGELLTKMANGQKSVLVEVHGAMVARPYKDRNGEDKISLDVTAYEIWPMIGGKNQTQESAVPAAAPTAAAASTEPFPQPDAEGFYDLPDDDDVPF